MSAVAMTDAHQLFGTVDFICPMPMIVPCVLHDCRSGVTEEAVPWFREAPQPAFSGAR